MITRGEAADRARRAARDLGYDVPQLDDVKVAEHRETFAVLLADSRFARGGGLLVVLDKGTGDVTEAISQL